MPIRANHGGVVKSASPRCHAGAGVVTPKSVHINDGGVWKKVWPDGPTGGSINGQWAYYSEFGDYRAQLVCNVQGGVAPYSYQWFTEGEFIGFGPAANQAEARSYDAAPTQISCLVTDGEGYSRLITGTIL
ncbi:MAG: hypothetical protein ACK4JY_07690 [Brevundimonas sp.]|uniref:hypothetical protein n=1 Tax=Brevundimonas sp. TaxID=1871086 RepID=UPI00391DC59F